VHPSFEVKRRFKQVTAPPPPPYEQAGAGAAPNNNLVWAILTTIFCCLPLGIVAIVKAAQVNGLWAQGQFDAARKAADDAKKWSIWAAVIGVVGIVLYLIFVFAVVGNSANY
jgi:Interferon-induced transmembrane protein